MVHGNFQMKTSPNIIQYNHHLSIPKARALAMILCHSKMKRYSRLSNMQCVKLRESHLSSLDLREHFCYTTCDDLDYPIPTHHLCGDSQPRMDRQVHRILNLLTIAGKLTSQHKQCSYRLRCINDHLLAVVTVDFTYRELWCSSLCSHAYCYPKTCLQCPACRTKGSLFLVDF